VSKALRVLANGGSLTVPGALNRFSVLAQRLIPRRIAPEACRKMSQTLFPVLEPIQLVSSLFKHP